ncbi:TetR/AcrR family transcriptional regulator [Lapidilactobacillus salsurivasis]
MVKATDLRVVKTRQVIQTTFEALLVTQPVNKITVTALARQARINKGTFYLHYADIFQLYEHILAETVTEIVASFHDYPALLTDQPRFIRQFLFGPAPTPTASQLAILKPDNLRFARNYPHIFIDAFRDAIYANTALTRSRDNDLRLEFVLNGMLAILIDPQLIDKTNATQVDQTVNTLIPVVAALFPQRT